MKKIAFIGLGIMGKSMARNVMKKGYELNIYARTRSKVSDLEQEGAVFYETIPACVKDADAVITIVGYPEDVEEVYFGENGILQNAKQGTYVIDMTTSSPKIAEKIDREAKERGLHALDAPVTGGDTGAKAGTLSILVGGAKEDYESCLPLFEAMGNNINYEGAAGAGQNTKLANQIMIAGTISGLCEALSYAKAKGLDLQTLLDSVATGAAGSRQLDTLAPRILKGDFAPGFFIKHFIKDMKLAASEAKSEELDLNVLERVLDNYETLAEAGCEEDGTQALIKFYEKCETGKEN
ncbi:NAD(P)-dependent oxidoreductase [Claveliimonas bilis]|uniref:NAD(P)-dependent oxidoreductase n=1 Tax=Claveliimonas bilis TaxID=3028070 RepID=UPI00292ECDB7|nr:NAD(P)-dependent oxidoreductase [Claveliimonas bilis]BDZ81782.1 putative oxidoreductase YkwC [Claveliimonas bilis]